MQRSMQPMHPMRFNPRPCARGDLRESIQRDRVRVSIHAPARGATNLELEMILSVAVSIHAPARGATASHTIVQLAFVFQSTPLREGRR